MKVIIAYPQLLDNGTNSETFDNVSDFRQFSYGVSFTFNGHHVIFPYNNILTVAVQGLDDNE